ncbi:PREDICTED: ATP-dependent zinc metalloprotease FtsH isoform X1 [Polistes canadensis]|uniref:ATP-dependent zinc metalloprotease FtsH isoform X1 n=1 Tax=Polistes canadensis TaxID=91411 RepID=UPI000718C143|nr:PREDICTED: ATP-dependent zinc metalloprotease FtsH isoform X1 [Polistes canadensis]
MFIPEANHYTMETLSNELENAPEFIPCSEDNVICSKCSIICNNENSLTVTSERVRRNRGTRTWQTCFKEIVPSKMILTNSEILNSGCSVTPKNEFRSNEDNKTESTIVSDNSIDSNSSCEIIFNDSTESNNEERIPESEIYDGDDYDDYEDYDSDDDNDENKDDSEEFSSESESDGDTSPNEDNCISKTKKVTFNLKPVVHTMIKWDYAYRAARKGPWEQMARDRSRFNGRISSYHLILDPILQDDHRVRIWTERFS